MRSLSFLEFSRREEKRNSAQRRNDGCTDEVRLLSSISDAVFRERWEWRDGRKKQKKGGKDALTDGTAFRNGGRSGHSM